MRVDLSNFIFNFDKILTKQNPSDIDVKPLLALPCCSFSVITDTY